MCLKAYFHQQLWIYNSLDFFYSQIVNFWVRVILAKVVFCRTGAFNASFFISLRHCVYMVKYICLFCVYVLYASLCLYICLCRWDPLMLLGFTCTNTHTFIHTHKHTQACACGINRKHTSTRTTRHII